MHLPGRFLPTAMCRHQPPFLYRNERNGHLEGGHQDGPRSPCSGLLCVLLMVASCSARRKLSESGFIFLLVYLEVHFLFIGNSTGGARTAIFPWVPPLTSDVRCLVSSPGPSARSFCLARNTVLLQGPAVLWLGPGHLHLVSVTAKVGYR